MSTPADPAASAPRTHDLKVRPQCFDALLNGTKTFELRKDDREPRFAVGDILVLHEYLPSYRGLIAMKKFPQKLYVTREQDGQDTYFPAHIEIPVSDQTEACAVYQLVSVGRVKVVRSFEK